MDKPKILCLSILPPPHHGVAVANDILLNSNLINNKFAVNLIPLNKPRLQKGGDFSLAMLTGDLTVTLRMIHIIFKEKPRLTYVALAQTKLGLWRDIFWICLAMLCRSKVLCHMHGGNFKNVLENQFSKGVQNVIKLVLRRLHGVIVLDPSLVFLFQGIVPDGRIFVLPNGVADAYGDAVIARVRSCRTNASRLRVTYLSNLLPGKGFDTFLETAAWLKDRQRENDFVFQLAGAAPDAATAAFVHDFIHSHGLHTWVKYLGKVLGPDKWDLLLNSDVFVFPPYQPEGQPLVIIEALSAGLPVISTARGCIPAMVQNGINGFIVSEGTPEEIGTRLILLKDNIPLWRSMSQASRELYLSRYTEEKFIQGFADIVERILESH